MQTSRKSPARDRLLKASKTSPQYLAGLSGEVREERKRALEARASSGGSREMLPGDKDAETEPSKYSKSDFAERVREQMKTNTKEAFIRATSKLSGVPARLIREVHERGAKAWEIGHRPGASQVAWARARVYSFLTGGKTQSTADADLWSIYLETLSQ